MKKSTLSSLLFGATLLLASGTLSLSAAEMKCGAGKCGGAMTQERTKQMTQKKDGTGPGNSAFGHAQKEANSKGKGKHKNKGKGKNKGDGSGDGQGKGKNKGDGQGKGKGKNK